MSFDIEIGDGAASCAIELKTTVEREGNRRSAAVAVAFEIESGEELIELAEVAYGQVGSKHGERIAAADSENARGFEIGSGSLQLDVLDDDGLISADVAGDRLARYRHIIQRPF